MYGNAQASGQRRSRRGRSRWQRRLSRVMSYLLACAIGVVGVSIGLIGVNAGGPADDPGGVWAGVIIGAVFVIAAIVWLFCLVASYDRRY